MISVNKMDKVNTKECKILDFCEQRFAKGGTRNNINKCEYIVGVI